MASSNKLEGDDGAALDERGDATWRAEWRAEVARVSPKFWETAHARIPRQIDELDLKITLLVHVADAGWLRSC
ncbi:hypothetical protein Sjap_008899 [Stephania japonica]|uniref:Uncharacterized protein n=1 Tax=Stephania japonica TaxID=461633 RepID=A0AAP0JRA0_9MAGN